MEPVVTLVVNPCVEIFVEKVVILVPAPNEDRTPVGLNVGIFVGTRGAMAVLNPVGKNEVFINVGTPVPKRTDDGMIDGSVARNVGITLGNSVPILVT